MPAKGSDAKEAITNTIELAPCSWFIFINMKTRIFSKIIFLMLSMPFLAFAQSNIEGFVKGSDGLLLQGVQVEIQETYFKTYTNQDGAFMFG